jgi:NADH dehydrogenase
MASLDGQDLTDYRHKDLGFVVDLGGRDAAANPFGVHLTGLAAKTVTRGYHLLAIPTIGNKLRIAADWLLHLFLKDQDVRLGFVAEPATRVIQP